MVQRSADATWEISANGSSWTTIGGVHSHDVDKRSETVDVDNYDSLHEQPHHAKDGTDFNFSYDRDEGDAGQQLIETARAAQRSDTYYYIRSREGVGSSMEEIYGLVVINSCAPSGSDKNYNKNRVRGKWKGQPTIQGQ